MERLNKSTICKVCDKPVDDKNYKTTITATHPITGDEKKFEVHLECAGKIWRGEAYLKDKK